MRAKPDWKDVHDRLLTLARRSAQLDWEIGHALLLAERARCHHELGYGSVIEYADRLLGFAPHTTRERLRVARALQDLPETTAALQAGAVSLSAVRELTRVVTPETETEWLGAARNARVREVEELVRGHEPGDLPNDPRNEAVEVKVVRLEVTPEAYALWREAEALVDKEAGEALTPSQRLELMARKILQAGSGDNAEAAGRASYQIALTQCRDCRKSWQQGRGKQVLVDPVVREMAECDAQHIGSVDTGQRRTRATQTVPPAIRREVSRREGGCCAVPGCTHSDFVDLHHIELRSEGGSHDPKKLLMLCSAHHRAVSLAGSASTAVLARTSLRATDGSPAVHEGRLLIAGDAVTGFVFRHADGSPYGARPQAAVAEVFAKAFAALTHNGFKEKQVRPVLERVRSHVGREVTAQEVIRAALRELCPG